MAPKILILSIILGAKYSFYVKSIAAYAPKFLGYDNLVLAKVCPWSSAGHSRAILP